jgi:hypothetical protein
MFSAVPGGLPVSMFPAGEKTGVAYISAAGAMSYGSTQIPSLMLAGNAHRCALLVR